MDPHQQLVSNLDALKRDLDDIDAASPVSQGVANVFNALLKMAQSEKSDDPIVGAIALDMRTTPTIGTLRILTGQLQNAIDV